MAKQDTIEGIGIGLRYAMARQTLASEVPEIRWLEIHPENYVQRGGRFRHLLEQAAERFPLVTHGLTLGFGAVERAEESYVRPLRDFLAAIGTPWHSEHLCFSGTDGVMLHDLLPLPFTREAVKTAVARIGEARDRLELPIALENVSYYADAGPAEMSEPEFLLEVLERSSCKMLLDVNNVFVNSVNHGFDARAYIDRIPAEAVVQIHVAGHLVRDDDLIIDTHGEAIREEVYSLLDYTLRRLGKVPVLLERDQNFPPFEELVAEVRRLDAIYREATAAWEQAQEPTTQAAGGVQPLHPASGGGGAP
ncbi:MAG: DUF692 domain-containing protein [Myxococcales bacterium]|nr:DUF692 domain-containing protein [Myxococcales bacterium]